MEASVVTVTSSAPAATEPLRVSVRRPQARTVVVEVSGAMDLATAPRLEELLTSRLRSAVTLLILDLSRVCSLSSAAIGVLTRARLLAQQRGVTLRVAAGASPAAMRALDAAGLTTTLNAAV
jgi:anti-sigma B factor antagonist